MKAFEEFWDPDEHKTWHEKHVEQSSFSERLADGVAAFMGSWWCLFLHAVWFVGWMIWTEAPPYQLLTLIVSLEAIFLSMFIMISQNRQSDRDRAQAEADYQTNIAAKREIEELEMHLAAIEDNKLDIILDILKPKAKTKKKK